jgi:hypothetical protein
MSQTPEDGCEPPVSGGHAFRGEAHEKRQYEERKHGAEQGDLPERRARHLQKCLRPALPRSWIPDVEARCSQSEIPRLGEQGQPGGLRRVEVAVDVRVVGSLLLIAVDPGGSVRERLHESEMSSLVVARGLLNEAGRENDRDDGDELESLPRTLRNDHALEYTLQSSPEPGPVVAPENPYRLRVAANASHAVVLGRPGTAQYRDSLRPRPARFSPTNPARISRRDH